MWVCECVTVSVCVCGVCLLCMWFFCCQIKPKITATVVVVNVYYVIITLSLIYLFIFFQIDFVVVTFTRYLSTKDSHNRSTTLNFHHPLIQHMQTENMHWTHFQWMWVIWIENRRFKLSADGVSLGLSLPITQRGPPWSISANHPMRTSLKYLVSHRKKSEQKRREERSIDSKINTG